MTEQTAFALAPGQIRRGLRVHRWFHIGVGISVILLSFADFAPSLIAQSRRDAPPSLSGIAHAFTDASWPRHFLTEATRVLTGRVGVHRRMGW